MRQNKIRSYKTVQLAKRSYTEKKKPKPADVLSEAQTIVEKRRARKRRKRKKLLSAAALVCHRVVGANRDKEWLVWLWEVVVVMMS